MPYFFVNLKRFDVPKKQGGICPLDDPQEWISSVIQESIWLGLGKLSGINLIYLLPEGLVSTAQRTLKQFPLEETAMVSIGCQGVHWQDVESGKNFGAFTSSLPAKAAIVLGSDWAIIGHSEERRAKFQVIEKYDDTVNQNPKAYDRAQESINQLINAEVLCAFKAHLNVLLCVGETAIERGEGTFDDQKPRIEAVIKKQLLSSLAQAKEYLESSKFVIGYEPVWAIGPGKTPPGADYIAFVSDYIKKVLIEKIGFEPLVIYGGGLKEENAGMIASIPTIDGGLVALTRFTGEIGFHVSDLKKIIQNFLAKDGH